MNGARGNADSALIAWAWHHARVVVLRLSKDDVIEAANRFARSFFGPGLVGAPFARLLPDFCAPPVISELVRKGATHRINVASQGGHAPRSLTFSFAPIEGGVLAIGECEVDELMRLEREIIAHHAELSAVTRDLHRQNATLVRFNQRLRDAGRTMATLEAQGHEVLATTLREGLSQDAFAVKLKLASLWAAKEELQGDGLEGTMGLVDDIIDQSRLLATMLSSPEPGDGKVSTAIEAAVEAFRLASGQGCVLGGQGELPALNLGEQFVLLQSLAALLANVEKHAQARSVSVSWAAREGGIELCVQDDGIGFEVPAAVARGRGLRRIRACVEVLGGEVTIESARGRGTQATLWIPGLAAAQDAGKPG